MLIQGIFSHMVYMMTWRHDGVGLPKSFNGIWQILFGLYIVAAMIRGLAQDALVVSVFSALMIFIIFFGMTGKLRFIVTSMLFVFCIGAFPLQAILIANDFQVNTLFLFWEVSALGICYFRAIKIDQNK